MSAMNRLFVLFVALFSLSLAAPTSKQNDHSKVYGVNIGNWLVFEPWMASNKWSEMTEGKSWINSEWELVKQFPESADEKFKKHWETWFTQDDVNKLQEYGINTVRIPLGYWIIEALVDRKTEHFPRGGLVQLKRGLKMLKTAGINVILVHHALPGVAAKKQQFAGRVTEDVQFYTKHNYARALTWAAIMTTLSHSDPDFSTVISIEAVNEPLSDGNKTPDLQQYYTRFAQTVRAVELSLGALDSSTKDEVIKVPGFNNIQLSANLALGDSLSPLKSFSNIDDEVTTAISSASDILKGMSQRDTNNLLQLEMNLSVGRDKSVKKSGLMVNFMDYNWQHSGKRANGAQSAIGPAMYDSHHYLAYGNVADPNEWAYLSHICNTKRLDNNEKQGQAKSSVVHGEWSLATQGSMGHVSDDFLKKFADAQKYAYGKGGGWIFWNFKTEQSVARQWSYFEGVKRGYFTKDPSKFHNPNICDKYKGK